AARQKFSLDEIELVLMFGRLVAEVEIRSVMADLDSVKSGEDIARGIGEFAGELTVGVAEEFAAFGIRRLLRDAELLEGEGVDHSPVSGGVHDVDLAVGGDLVEFLLARVPPLSEVALFVA